MSGFSTGSMVRWMLLWMLQMRSRFPISALNASARSYT